VISFSSYPEYITISSSEAFLNSVIKTSNCVKLSNGSNPDKINDSTSLFSLYEFIILSEFSKIYLSFFLYLTLQHFSHFHVQVIPIGTYRPAFL
jgi:hypothetical protein